MKAQLSLEALLAYAAFLSACALLISAAASGGRQLDSSIQKSSAANRLSYEALSLDVSAEIPSSAGIKQNYSSAPSDGNARIAWRADRSVNEPLLHDVSSGLGGKMNVKRSSPEPV